MESKFYTDETGAPVAVFFDDPPKPREASPGTTFGCRVGPKPRPAYRALYEATCGQRDAAVRQAATYREQRIAYQVLAALGWLATVAALMWR